MAFAKSERRDTHERVEGPEFYPVYKPELFADSLFQMVRQRQVTLKEFEAMVQRNTQEEAGIIRFGTVRRIDLTGLVPNMLTPEMTAEEVLEKFDAIAANQLNIIRELPIYLSEQVFSAMEGRRVTLPAIKVLVERQDAVMNILEQQRKQSALALCVRDLNAEAVDRLYQRSDLHSIYDGQVENQHGLEGRKRLGVLHEGKPRISYIPHAEGGMVTSVDQYYFAPNLWNVTLSGKIFEEYVKQDESIQVLEGRSIGELINTMTPNVFKKANEYLYPADPRTLTGYMKRVGLGTSHFFRDITNWFNQRLEEEVTATNLEHLREFFTHN